MILSIVRGDFKTSFVKKKKSKNKDLERLDKPANFKPNISAGEYYRFVLKKKKKDVNNHKKACSQKIKKKKKKKVKKEIIFGKMNKPIKPRKLVH